MGTWYRVKLITGEPLAPNSRAEFEELVLDRLTEVDGALSTYRPDSLVSRFNRSQPGEAVPFDSVSGRVLTLALAVAEETEGAFDPTVGPLVDAWGFGPDGPRDRPEADRLAALRERVGWRLLRFRDGDLSKTAPGVEIDLSAIAKGFAVDLVAESLAAREGLLGVMVEVGGEIRVAGLNRERRPWRLAIESPTTGTRGIQRIVELTGLAIATSGDYRNFWESEGRRYSHIIDPGTGAPVTHRAASVSVIAPECAVADAYATALLVMGPERGLEWARDWNVPVLFLVYNDEGGVDELATAEMARHLGIEIDERGHPTGRPAAPAA